MLKTIIAITSISAALYNPAIAQHISVFEECKRYLIEEEYVQGGINNKGNYKKGHIETRRHRIGCNPYREVTHSYPYGHHPHPYGHQMPPQAPVSSHHPAVAPAAQNQCGKVARMGLGGLLGGTAGYFAVGGKKSSKTLLGTAIGTGVGAVLGRISC